MALPTKAKTWTVTPCTRVVWASQLQMTSDLMYAIKVALKLATGCTVKGSCNGVTGAMDGTDRWASAANVQTRNNGAAGAQSWIVLDFANMGGTELLLTYNSSVANGFSFYFSPGGNYVAAGTPAQKPTATDEVTIVASGLLYGAASVDRLWSTWVASDGSAVAFGVASAGAWETFVPLQLVTSRIVAPATFSPAVAAFRVGAALSPTGALSSWATALPVCRVDPGAGGVNVTGFFGCEGYKTGQAPALLTSTSVLQGTVHNLYPVSLWSETATVPGAVGNWTDVWCGNTGANDGDTYPNDATRTFIQVLDFVLPWGGTAPVMA